MLRFINPLILYESIKLLLILSINLNKYDKFKINLKFKQLDVSL